MNACTEGGVGRQRKKKNQIIQKHEEGYFMGFRIGVNEWDFTFVLLIFVTVCSTFHHLFPSFLY